ncbi:hypothetical protein [Pseudodesulfovibrio pelocollis]|uniref:hypothetical protein n=1 Tax=Pseudodesulfovibrio pelocollis TaxID=3051432 RepID=UPI00255ACB6B|nr:hypothetical protein [Pseudodesulfovibrio sp. SB368]
MMQHNANPIARIIAGHPVDFTPSCEISKLWTMLVASADELSFFIKYSWLYGYKSHWTHLVIWLKKSHWTHFSIGECASGTQLLYFFLRMRQLLCKEQIVHP